MIAAAASPMSNPSEASAPSARAKDVIAEPSHTTRRIAKVRTLDKAMRLVDALPKPPTADAIYEAFMTWTAEQGLELYPHQEEAAIEIFSGNNAIVATPTGSGKSMIAIAA